MQLLIEIMTCTVAGAAGALLVIGLVNLSRARYNSGKQRMWK